MGGIHPFLRFEDEIRRIVCITNAIESVNARFGGHREVRARVEHAFAHMKTWKILRDCRLKGDGVHHAMLGLAHPHNLALAG